MAEPAAGFVEFGLVELAGGFVRLEVELFEPGAVPFAVNGAAPFEVAGVLRFHRVAVTPKPATSTNRMIRNGRYRFIESKNGPRRVAFRDRRRLLLESKHAGARATL